MHSSQIEQLPQLRHRVVRVLHSMSICSRIGVELVVIATFECLIAEEVYCGVLDSASIFLGREMLQAVRFVPAGREDIEANLAADGVAISGWSVYKKGDGCE